jgi:hypothetical protein
LEWSWVGIPVWRLNALLTSHYLNNKLRDNN